MGITKINTNMQQCNKIEYNEPVLKGIISNYSNINKDKLVKILKQNNVWNYKSKSCNILSVNKLITIIEEYNS